PPLFTGLEPGAATRSPIWPTAGQMWGTVEVRGLAPAGEVARRYTVEWSHHAPAFAPPLSPGRGPLSPIWRTLPRSSDICMPERASNRAGTCAAILAMSPVIL